MDKIQLDYLNYIFITSLISWLLAAVFGLFTSMVAIRSIIIARRKTTEFCQMDDSFACFSGLRHLASKIIRSGILSSKSTDSGDGVITTILFSVVLFFFIIFFTVYVLVWHDWYWILTAPDSYLANHDTV